VNKKLKLLDKEELYKIVHPDPCSHTPIEYRIQALIAKVNEIVEAVNSIRRAK
jgi:hypothetical protein